MLNVILAGALALAAPQRTDTTFAVQPGGRLEVDNYSGAVTVRSWQRNEIRIQATHGSDTEIEIDHSARSVAVDVSMSRGLPDAVNFVITVPQTFRVSVDGVNTSADIEGIGDDVSVETVNGNVTVRDVTGRVNVEAVSGLVTVERVNGRVTASSTNQGLRISAITGDIHAEAVNGSIDMRGVESSSVSAETINGGILLDGALRDGGSYTLSTTNGGITLAVPAGTNAVIDASTFNGRFDTSLPLQLDARRSGSYTFNLGTGSARIRLESFAGTIRLVRPAELTGGTQQP
jgi:DUF4097 and DUF4098 domain-containing protein YvlB